jgi:hypothetical protein
MLSGAIALWHPSSMASGAVATKDATSTKRARFFFTLGLKNCCAAVDLSMELPLEGLLRKP